MKKPTLPIKMITNYFNQLLSISVSKALSSSKRNKKILYRRKVAASLDQFYTNPLIAKICYNQLSSLIDMDGFDVELEPSAGDGAFFHLMSKVKRYGIDLDPKSKYIKKCDFFQYIPPIDKKIITIGNPPFGKNASLAVKFFNKAAEFSNVIAFIVPKTFKKLSLINRLDVNFKLLFQEDLPNKSFIYNGEPYNVPCCFQIWQKTNKPRKIVKIDLTNDIFEFVNKNEADFAVRRVGGTTGKVQPNLSDAAEVSHYFLKLKNKNIDKNKLILFINNLNLSVIINSTAGVRSLSKQEFVKVFFQYFNIQDVL